MRTASGRRWRPLPDRWHPVQSFPPRTSQDRQGQGGDEKVVARQQSVQQKLFALIRDGMNETKLRTSVADLTKGLRGAEAAAIHAQVSLLANEPARTSTAIVCLTGRIRRRRPACSTELFQRDRVGRSCRVPQSIEKMRL